MSQPEYEFARRIFHHRVVHALATLAPIKQLVRELIGHGKVKAVSAGFIQVFGNRRGYEPLKLIEVDVKRLYAIPFASFHRCRPQIREQEHCKQLCIFFGDFGPLCGQVYEDDRALLQRLPEVEGDLRLTEDTPHRFVLVQRETPVGGFPACGVNPGRIVRILPTCTIGTNREKRAGPGRQGVESTIRFHSLSSELGLPISNWVNSALILVIEDDEKMRQGIAWALEDAGHRVKQAADFHAAMVAMNPFCSENPRVIVTDVVMPEKSGLDVILKLRPVYPSVGILAISGHPAFLEIALRDGADKVLVKSFTAAELLSAVRELLDSPKRPANQDTLPDNGY